jgi:hypothetical protein
MLSGVEATFQLKHPSTPLRVTILGYKMRINEHKKLKPRDKKSV